MNQEELRGRMKAEWHVMCGRCGDSEYLDAHEATLTGRRAKLAEQSGWKYTRDRGWLCALCKVKPRA